MKPKPKIKFNEQPITSLCFNGLRLDIFQIFYAIVRGDIIRKVEQEVQPKVFPVLNRVFLANLGRSMMKGLNEIWYTN